MTLEQTETIINDDRCNQVNLYLKCISVTVLGNTSYRLCVRSHVSTWKAVTWETCLELIPVGQTGRLPDYETRNTDEVYTNMYKRERTRYVRQCLKICNSEYYRPEPIWLSKFRILPLCRSFLLSHPRPLNQLTAPSKFPSTPIPSILPPPYSSSHKLSSPPDPIFTPY